MLHDVGKAWELAWHEVSPQIIMTRPVVDPNGVYGVLRLPLILGNGI